LHAYSDGWQAEISLSRFLWSYCYGRPHSALGDRTPREVNTESEWAWLVNEEYGSRVSKVPYSYTTKEGASIQDMGFSFLKKSCNVSLPQGYSAESMHPNKLLFWVVRGGIGILDYTLNPVYDQIPASLQNM